MPEYTDIEDILKRGGFSTDQVEALMECFSTKPHTHDMDDVIGLEEQLADIESEIDNREDDDEED